MAIQHAQDAELGRRNADLAKMAFVQLRDMPRCLPYGKAIIGFG
jgi:hypothetical protein